MKCILLLLIPKLGVMYFCYEMYILAVQSLITKLYLVIKRYTFYDNVKCKYMVYVYWILSLIFV